MTAIPINQTAFVALVAILAGYAVFIFRLIRMVEQTRTMVRLLALAHAEGNDIDPAKIIKATGDPNDNLPLGD
jgi:hypothetical protein